LSDPAPAAVPTPIAPASVNVVILTPHCVEAEAIALTVAAHGGKAMSFATVEAAGAHVRD
jgi:hypothetical protein